MNLLVDEELAAIDRHLRAVLDRMFAHAGMSRFTDVIGNYVLSGGKRIRPQMCVWTYRQAGGSGLPESLLDLACAWELFHAFLLAHDDIIDAADTRRGRMSLHRELASLDHGSPVFGTNLAIVSGDLLFGAAMRLINDLDLPPAPYRAVNRLFSRVACTTGFGQAIDICQASVPLDDVAEPLLMRGYDWKTAAYTFEGPMLSGAMVAGASDEAAAAISSFARAIGQAYQLHNDLLDLARPAHDGCDLMQGKRTVTLMHARSLMPPTQRTRFDARLDELKTANGHALAIAEELRQELRDGGAEAATRHTIDASLDRASSAAADSALSNDFRSSLSDLLRGMRHGYFATV